MSGYALIYRTLLDHAAFRNDAEAMAFGWMIIRASWRDVVVRYKGHRIELKRGQLAISQRDMAIALDRDKGWVERLWKRLRAEAMIEADAKAGVAVITICNYDTFQQIAPPGKAAGKARGAVDKRQAKGSGEAQNKEGNTGKKEKPPIAPRKRVASGKTAIPEDWQVPPVAELPPKARSCAAQWTPESYATHAEAFVLYWRSTGRMMKDWRATWANRVISLNSQVMRDQRFGNAPPGEKKPSKPLTAAEHENLASWYEDHGQPDSAIECRRKAAALRQAPSGERGGAPKAIGQVLSALPLPTAGAMQ